MESHRSGVKLKRFCKENLYMKTDKGKVYLLDQLIQQEGHKLLQLLMTVPEELQEQLLIEGPTGTISISNLLAYQIGWGTLLLGWYKAGIKNKTPEMPGEGFTQWDYTGLARHFYHRYNSYNFEQKIALFRTVIDEISTITEQEQALGRLNVPGIWPWCTLRSGKMWPLSKWIQVNTIAPYKKAIRLIKKCLKDRHNAIFSGHLIEQQ